MVVSPDIGYVAHFLSDSFDVIYNFYLNSAQLRHESAIY